VDDKATESFRTTHQRAPVFSSISSGVTPTRERAATSRSLLNTTGLVTRAGRLATEQTAVLITAVLIVPRGRLASARTSEATGLVGGVRLTTLRLWTLMAELLPDITLNARPGAVRKRRIASSIVCCLSMLGFCGAFQEAACSFLM